MTKRNPNFSRLPASYLFPELNRRKRLYQQSHPEAKIISLGVGDTTHPLPTDVAAQLSKAGSLMATKTGYIGYGPEQGQEHLRQLIAERIYQGKIRPEEVFISDGAKCDIGRLQTLFGNDVSIAVQNPAYPVYVEGSIIHGIKHVVHLPCTPENEFCPNWDQVERSDLIYWCSPNNPTGAVSTKQQLEKLVALAKKNRSIIIFDSAYSHFIRDPEIPRSIYEIEGAEEVAIEISSFSKLAGFTGVRLGWSIVPNALKYEDGNAVQSDWKRVTSTIFNGASCLAQSGGIEVLSDVGLQACEEIIAYYLENAAMIKEVLESHGLSVYGGRHAPYLWVKFPRKTSWEAFQSLLEDVQIVATPGSGFGPAGEGFLRFSAFGTRESTIEAVNRLRKFVI